MTLFIFILDVVVLIKLHRMFCRRAGRSIGRHNHGYSHRSNTTLYRISPKQKVRNIRPSLYNEKN